MAENNNNYQFTFDALLPQQMAEVAEEVGVKKAKQEPLAVFLLAILAGAFIAFAAHFCLLIMTGTKDALGFGLTKVMGGLAFSLGLVLVIIGGAELFTGNNLKIMAFASRKITFGQVVWNWTVVYVGNFIGAVITVYGLYLTRYYECANGIMGLMAVDVANYKCGLDFTTALVRGIYCNVFVCLAVWLCYSARSNTDKILCIIFPITAFVACGFEHSIANMYFVPMGLALKANPEFLATVGKTSSDFANLNVPLFLHNLLAVTIGNIIGGAVLVGAVYWLIYRRKNITPTH